MAEKLELSEEQQADKKLIENSLNWPRWPLLPMKRYTKEGMQAAFMHSTSRILLYGVSIYSLNGKDGEEWSKVLARIPQRFEYQSIEDLLLDGWKVD